MRLPDLPIIDALPHLGAALEEHAAAVLVAPPGAGKSTLVPLALLDAAWLGPNRILMLEPRRIAARAVAQRMAHLLGERPGERVGYRTRLDTQVSAATRIEVVTEGILTRMLEGDPALEGIGIVIFDEFHERSLQADLGLALCLDMRAHLREDLRLLVMSATLASEAVAEALGTTQIVRSHGRSFPVDTVHLDKPLATDAARSADLIRAVTALVVRAIDETAGDILVFLPGQREIRRVAAALDEHDDAARYDVRMLYGDLPANDQDAALAPGNTNRRRIVLATNVAETSLTIEGIGVVVDSGLERRSRFDPAIGMSRLVTVRISQASADQRRGRAGRLGPGRCYRLWTESEHAMLAPHTPAEILEADLAPLALEIAAWGATDPDELHWLDPPPRAALAQARDLLASLGALDAGRRITEHGRAMARLGVHPRLAHLLLEARRSHQTRLGAEIAAILSERDLLRAQPGAEDVDLRSRLELLSHSAGHGTEGGARRRVLRTADLLERRIGLPGSRAATDLSATGGLLALAYPDRIAQRRGTDGRYLLSSGRGAHLPSPQLLGRSEYLVVAELDAGERAARIRIAAPIERDELAQRCAALIEMRDHIGWDDRQGAVIARRERRLGALVLEEHSLDDPPSAAIRTALFAALRRLGAGALPFDREARALQARVAFLRAADDALARELTALDDATLLDDLDNWLAPWTEGMRRLADLERLDMHAILAGLLTARQRRLLDELAPTHLVVPSGSRIAIDYGGATPTLAVRLQELFGLLQTPRLACGRVPLTIELLSPAHRPVQVTRDLASFWAHGYHDVKRELKGRYPKHHWPDDPLTATPTARAKPRR